MKTIKQLIELSPLTFEKVYYVELWVGRELKSRTWANGSHDSAVIAAQLLAAHAGARMAWG